MEEKSKKELENILKDIQTNNSSFLDNGNGFWVLMLLALMFSQPPKPEQPVTNIYVGGEK